ncbi:MAG: DUF4435 domain-containing protein [Erysipelotrichales bacterium]|nr:DUF4435 domain-containing protein [Erysipelotrichales bacterium]
MKIKNKEDMLLSPSELADELSMNSKVNYLLVEGETDRLFWEHLQNDGLRKKDIKVACKKNCNSNKEYVEKVVCLMNKRNKKNVVGIVDYDYDYLRGTCSGQENLYYYKYIDLENVLIQSRAFSEVNTCISSKKKKKSDLDLRNIIYSDVYILGLLRLLNDIEKYNFSFEDIEYKNLFKGEERFVEYFVSKMRLSVEMRNEVNGKLNDFRSKNYDKEYVCNGHDLINCLSLLTKKEISNDNPIVYNEKILQQMLILAYHKNKEEYDLIDCDDILMFA